MLQKSRKDHLSESYYVKTDINLKYNNAYSILLRFGFIIGTTVTEF